MGRWEEAPLRSTGHLRARKATRLARSAAEATVIAGLVRATEAAAKLDEDARRGAQIATAEQVGLAVEAPLPSTVVWTRTCRR